MKNTMPAEASMPRSPGSVPALAEALLGNLLGQPLAGAAQPHAATKVAVSYLRVSTEKQAKRDGDPEGYSIPAQREANQRKAALLNSTIVEEFPDRGESARSAARPELQRMLKYITEHKVDYVIVHKVDRLARNRADDVNIHEALIKSGVQLVSATENIDETPSGMLLHGIMSTIAEFYSRNLSSEVKKGMSQKAKSGGTPRRAPLGYLNVRERSAEGREVRTVEVDSERGPLIAWAFKTYATGEWTLLKLAKELTSRGLLTVPTPKFASKPISPTTLHKVLTNPYYKGVIVYNGAHHEGRHQRLIDPITWQRVQSILASHAIGEKQREHPHYLRSTVYCGKCKSRLVVANAKNRHGTIYPYFVCLGRQQRRTDCSFQATLITTIETKVEEEYAKISLPPELKDRIRTTLLTLSEADTQQAALKRADLQKTKGRLLAEREKLLQAHYASAIPLELLRTEQDRIASNLEHIDAQLLEATANANDLEANLSAGLDLINDCYHAYKESRAHVRRLFNQAFFERI